MTQILAEKKSLNVGLFVLLGIIFWFSGVLFVRLGGAVLFVKGDLWLLVLFALALPISWVFVKVTEVIGRVSGLELLRAVVLESIAATIIDGTVLTWFQPIYSDDRSTLLAIAAWLLWGAGMGLAVAYWESQRSFNKNA
jgi:hypothetical protein